MPEQDNGRMSLEKKDDSEMVRSPEAVCEATGPREMEAAQQEEVFTPAERLGGRGARPYLSPARSVSRVSVHTR
jgi:hypothetical protein